MFGSIFLFHFYQAVIMDFITRASSKLSDVLSNGYVRERTATDNHSDENKSFRRK
jgi:hypothetical protein